MLASHVIKSRRIATRISFDLPVICFQRNILAIRMYLTAPLGRYMKKQVRAGLPEHRLGPPAGPVGLQDRHGEGQ
jgi:hypothetical protein